MPWEEIGVLLGMLLVLVAVLFAAYWFTRYMAGHGMGGRAFSRLGGRGGCIRLVERAPLGKEQSLVVAQVGESWLLLGVTPSQVTLLRELSQEEAALWDPPPEDGSGPEKTPPRFQDALAEVLRQKKK